MTILAERPRLERATDKFLTDNPNVFPLFETYALVMLKRAKKFGVKLLIERVRWHVLTQWDYDTEGFKINNNFAPYIARRLIRKHPGLKDLIQLRRIRAV